jgi:GTP-binding protein
VTCWRHETVCTAFNGSQLPKPEMPEVVFLGRSNVGKSTLINSLLGRTHKKVAYVSSKPGKTRSANFYKICAPGSDGDVKTFCLVDMPGYGYAARGRDEKAKWWALANHYFSGSRNISFAVHLIDFRHGPLAGDGDLTEWLDSHDIARMIVFTKGDKVPRGRLKAYYEKYVRGGLVSILPPIVTEGKNDASAEGLRLAMLEIIQKLDAF